LILGGTSSLQTSLTQEVVIGRSSNWAQMNADNSSMLDAWDVVFDA